MELNCHAEFRVKRSLVSKDVCCGNENTEDTNLPYYMHAYKSQFFSDKQFIYKLNHNFLQCKARR